MSVSAAVSRRDEKYRYRKPVFQKKVGTRHCEHPAFFFHVGNHDVRLESSEPRSQRNVPTVPHDNIPVTVVKCECMQMQRKMRENGFQGDDVQGHPGTGGRVQKAGIFSIPSHFKAQQLR